MSELRERLNRFKKPESERRPQAPVSISEDWSRIGAHLETNEWGSFIMRRLEYGAHSYHGRYQLGELSDRAHELSCFYPGTTLSQEDMIFFDTETTGLGVGAGNVPFMIGIGYYRGESFVVEQLFIRNPSEEQAMLSYLQEKLSRFTHIVSYNGRTFDWPILKNRYVLNRLPFEDSELLHLDFLYPSRSLWRNTLPSCRLGKVEEDRLGFKRENDVPGSMAPALYFLYLAEKDARVLEGVFVHNEHDIVTLAALATHFSMVLGGELRFQELEDEELFRTGLWLNKMNRCELADQAFECLWSRFMGPDYSLGQSGELILQLADVYKKQTKYERAVRLWERHIELHNGGIALYLEPYTELAMYYEHKERNVEQALFYAEEAWARLWRRRSLSRRDSKQLESEQSLQKRLDRLQNKRKNVEAGKSASALTKPSTRKRREKPAYAMESLV
jgi:uncharacterized protein YprB with RNaseH-like and TPR domain